MGMQVGLCCSKFQFCRSPGADRGLCGLAFPEVFGGIQLLKQVFPFHTVPHCAAGKYPLFLFPKYFLGKQSMDDT